jgi:methylamine dehydrogenase light chain
MSKFIGSMLDWMDRAMEKQVRTVAQTRGRRSFLTRFGAILVGGTMLPMLPFDRNSGAASAAEPDQSADDTKCEYWAYCGIDGTRCNACGGSISQCPPGSEPSKVSWIGTCINPTDKKAYLVSYSDCCGKAPCEEDANCSRHVGERPGYRIGTFSDMNWCMANTNKAAHCSTAMIVGIADIE